MAGTRPALICAQPIGWDSRARADLDGLAGVPAADYEAMPARLFAVGEGDRRIGSMLLRLDTMPGGCRELVVVALKADAFGADFLDRIAVVLDRIAADAGAWRVWFDTARPALIRQAARIKRGRTLRFGWEL